MTDPVSFNKFAEAAKKLDLDLAEGRQLPGGFHPELDLQIWGAGCGRRPATATAAIVVEEEGGRVVCHEVPEACRFCCCNLGFYRFLMHSGC